MGSYRRDNFYPTFDKKIDVVKNVDTSAPQLCSVRMVAMRGEDEIRSGK